MRWGFSAQRRADEFALAIDVAPERAVAAGDSRDADLLELVGALRAVPAPTARPDFVADLRTALLAEAVTVLEGAEPDEIARLRLPPRRPARQRRLAALVGSVAAVCVTAGVAVASQGALPGEALYPVKRAIEDAHAGLSTSDSGKGATLLSSASDRLDEADALTRQDHLGDDQRVADTLDTFSEQARHGADLLLADYAHGGDPDSVASVRDFASASLDRLALLEPLVPTEARDALLGAARTLEGIDADAARACPDCGGTPIDSIPPVLAGALAPVVEPAPTPVAPARSGGHHGGGPHLPHVDPGHAGPGSVTDPSAGPTPGSTSGPTPGGGPIQSLTDGLTGGLDQLTGGSGGAGHSGGAHPSGGSSAPDVGGTVGEVVDGLDGLLGGLLGPSGGPTP